MGGLPGRAKSHKPIRICGSSPEKLQAIAMRLLHANDLQYPEVSLGDQNKCTAVERVISGNKLLPKLHRHAFLFPLLHDPLQVGNRQVQFLGRVDQALI